MVPPEEARGDEVGNDYVYGVVIVREKDAEHANDAERPTPPVIAPEASRRVCKTRTGKVFRISETALLSIYLMMVQPYVLHTQGNLNNLRLRWKSESNNDDVCVCGGGHFLLLTLA